MAGVSWLQQLFLVAFDSFPFLLLKRGECVGFKNFIMIVLIVVFTRPTSSGLTPWSLSKSTPLRGGHRCSSCLRNNITRREQKILFSFFILSIKYFVFFLTKTKREYSRV
jgi:hypothetical protein